MKAALPSKDILDRIESLIGENPILKIDSCRTFHCLHSALTAACTRTCPTQIICLGLQSSSYLLLPSTRSMRLLICETVRWTSHTQPLRISVDGEGTQARRPKYYLPYSLNAERCDTILGLLRVATFSTVPAGWLFICKVEPSILLKATNSSIAIQTEGNICIDLCAIYISNCC